MAMIYTVIRNDAITTQATFKSQHPQKDLTVGIATMTLGSIHVPVNSSYEL